MVLRRPPTRTTMIDVLDRVLDKGIVIDAWVKLSIGGIEVVGVDARVIVASIDTYVQLAETLSPATGVSPTAPAVLQTKGATSHRGQTRRPRALKRPAVTLHCEHGCGFTERGGQRPRRVRCPYDAGRVCRLQPT